MINKNGLKLIKQEAQKLSRNDEIQANILYKKIWGDIILQYIVAGSLYNTFIFWLDDYIKVNNIGTEALLISKLMMDGFKLGLRKEYPDAYAIPKEKVLEYINNDNKEYINQAKMPITPFTETRRR